MWGSFLPLPASVSEFSAVKLGDVYNARKVQAVFEQIRAFYAMAGRIPTCAEILSDFDDVAARVSLRFRIKLSPPVRVARIEFEGIRWELLTRSSGARRLFLWHAF